MNVALNISQKNIKIISIEGRRVKKWGMAEIPPDLVSDGLILKPQTLGPLISDLFKKVGIPRERVTCGIAGLAFTYRFITLPRMKPGLIEEALLRAAKKEISIPLEELYVAWQRFPDTGNEMSYFVLGVERNRIDAMVETLKSARIEPYLMGIRPLALTRIAERSEGILVNFEESCFDIVFMSGGLPRVIHTINPRNTSVTLEDNVHRLADELTKTATFYRSNNPDAELDNSTPLLITGDWVAEPAAIAILQTEVEYPISRLVAQVEIPEGLPMDSYAATIGLALKAIPPKTAKSRTEKYTDVNVNILAGKYRVPKAKPVPLSRVMAWVLLAAALILLFPLYRTYTDVKSKNASLALQINDTQRLINIYNTITEEDLVTENTITGLTTAAENITAAYRGVLSSRENVRTDLELVTSLVPDKTYFSSIEIFENEIIINGESDSVFTVVSYASELKKQARFSDVRIDKLQEGQSAYLTVVSANVTAVSAHFPAVSDNVSVVSDNVTGVSDNITTVSGNVTPTITAVPIPLPVPVTVIEFVIIIKK
jgi:type IV pilus assembly protein PilM